MFTPASALLWEIRRSLRWRFWLTLFAIMFFPSLVSFVMALQHGRGDLRTWEFRPMEPAAQMILTMVNLLLCMILIGYAIGRPARHFALPVSTQTLATVRLLPGAATCATLYLLLAATLNLLLAAGWPYIGPATTYGVAFMVLYSAVYQFRGNETREGITALALVTALIFWMGSHHGPVWWKAPDSVWTDLTATEVVILLATAGFAWTSLVSALNRDRRGAGWGRVLPVTTETQLLAERSRGPARKFWSPATALFWQEWKQDGMLLPAVLALLTLVFALVHFGALAYVAIRQIPVLEGPSDQRGVPITVGMIFLPIAFAAPWFLGLTGQHGKRAVGQGLWPTGQAALPISDTALAWVITARVLASSLLAGLAVLLVTATWLGALQLLLMRMGEELGGWPPLTRLDVAHYIGSCALTLWLTTTFSTAATLSGRWWVASIPICMVPAWILVMFLSALIPAHQERELFLTGVVFTLLGVALVGTVVAYIFAIAWDVIRIRSLLFGFTLFVVSEYLGYWYFREQATLFNGAFSPPLTTMMYMLFALTAAPPALIPMAVYWNRHR